MSQHFLLTAAAPTVSLKQVLRMEEDEAWALFCSIRWPEPMGRRCARGAAARRAGPARGSVLHGGRRDKRAPIPHC
jgi:hypothetical protein